MAGNVAPNIVQDQLIFYVDAGNTKSYISGSTVWYDLTSNLYTGSFVNSPIYEEPYKGSIKFNGTNQYINCRDFSWTVNDSFSLNVTFKLSAVKTYHGLMGKPGPSWEWFLGVWNGSLLYVYYNSSGQLTSANIFNITPVLENWYTGGITYDGINKICKMYVNGGLVATSGIPYDVGAAGNPTFVNRTNNMYLGNTYWGDNYLNGNIASALIYNKNLSADEMLQNYNALKGRYILQ
jgi:Concanavalin A-like lectin/glucanases superfamily